MPSEWYLSSGPTTAATPAGPGLPPPPLPPVDVTVVAHEAVTNLQLPLPGIEIGPDPSVNEWNMLAVGQPVWLWADGTNSVDASTTQQGIALTLTARRDALTISTGDGTVVDCVTSTPRPSGAAPMSASPDCGHVWTRHGTYTVTATSSWTVTWSALGQSGSVPMQRSSSRTVEVGQLASVLVR